jgi:hypothetical protein
MRKTMLLAAVFLIGTTGIANAGMRHDRRCDVAQEKSTAEELNPGGGNAVMFGPCGGVKDLLIHPH